MSQGPWKKKLEAATQDYSTIRSVTRATSTDIAVRSAETNTDLATLTQNCESLLGLFDARALDAALIASGWSMTEDVGILASIARGEEYKIIDPVSGEVTIMKVSPRDRLAARKEMRALATEIATLNGVVRRMTQEGPHTVSMTVKGPVDGVMQLMAKRTQHQLDTAPRHEVVDAQFYDPERHDEPPETPQATASDSSGHESGPGTREPGAIARCDETPLGECGRIDSHVVPANADSCATSSLDVSPVGEVCRR